MPDSCTPAACTLTPGALVTRLAEFDAVFAAGLRSAELLSPVRARWEFTAGPADASRLGDLLRRESECCSFFGFDQRADGGRVTVDVTVPPAHAATLAALARQAAGHLAPPPATP
jgi:hypothetical protein